MTLQLDDLDLLNEPIPTGVPLQLPVDDIDEDPQQPRQEFKERELRQLADSIERCGVLQAISVRPHPEAPRRWLLNLGARRLRASKMLGKPTIPAYVDAGADGYAQVIENEQREDLRPLELALFVQRRLALGETQAQIARGLGKSQPYVVYASALIDPPGWLMTLYRQGKCQGMTELYHLKRLQAVAPQRVLAWAEQRASITRADLQALKLELRTAAVSAKEQGGSSDGSIEPLIEVVAPLEAPSVAPPAAQSRPDHRLTASAQPVDHSPPPARDGATRSNATNPSATRLALFARHAEHDVEILLDVAPNAPGQVYVRRCSDDARLTIAASELRLTGFERAAQTQ